MSHFFTREGILNTHIMYFWADTNPKAGREVLFQRRFNINVWAGVIGNLLLGPHVFQGTLNGAMYWNFLLHYLPRILHEVERARRQRIVYQEDGYCSGGCRGVLLTRRPKLAEWT